LGFGSQSTTNKPAKAGKSIEAIDISSGILDFAKKEAEKNSISNIKYVQASILDDRFNHKNSMQF
jgi:2-polyprenyl-3-methyl-5-hydroxy-6-metoxy-1,4-benzoquinol methylase